MNAAASATVEPVTGTIGERIIKALRASKGLATLDDLKKVIDCNNPALIELQLATMRKRGDVYIPKPGHFAFTASFRDTPDTQGSPEPVERSTPLSDPPSTQEPVMAKKECNECHQQKDAEKDFYTGSAKCKPCYNARALARKNGEATPAKKAAALKPAAAPTAASAADVLVIPASGAITCRMTGDTAEITQFEEMICCTREQLQALRDWATAQLKRAAA